MQLLSNCTLNCERFVGVASLLVQPAYQWNTLAAAGCSYSSSKTLSSLLATLTYTNAALILYLLVRKYVFVVLLTRSAVKISPVYPSSSPTSLLAAAITISAPSTPSQHPWVLLSRPLLQSLQSLPSLLLITLYTRLLASSIARLQATLLLPAQSLRKPSCLGNAVGRLLPYFALNLYYTLFTQLLFARI